MPEGEKETKPHKPDLDPIRLLTQIESFVKAKSTDVGSHGHPGRVAKSWLWSMLIGVVVFAGIAVVVWFSSKRNRELAKLRHEKNKAKVLREQAIVDKAVKLREDEIADKQKIIDSSNERLRIIEADISAEEKRYEADLRAIDNICSWRECGLR